MPNHPRIPHGLDAVWKSPAFGWILIPVGFALSAWWLFNVPSPGKAVAALGVAAAIMSLRPDATGLERSAWMLVIFAFVFVESHAIDKDRADARKDADERQAKAAKVQSDSFAKVLDKNQQA